MKALRKSKKWFLLIALLSMMVVSQAIAAENGSDNDVVHLQILTVNDFHGALAETGTNIGAAKLVQLLNDIKTQDPDGTLMMSAGDMFQGTPDSNLLYGETVVDVMNYTGFDVMTLGNHEFDWGIDILKQRIAQSGFPYVCANLLDKRTGKIAEFVRPYTILERNGVKIGVIGITTPETAIKANPKMIADYTFADPSKVVNALVPELKQQGADIIVVLTHLGSSLDGDGNIRGEAATLAVQTKGIDAIVSGHSHQIVYGKVNDIPIVQAGYNGRAVGKIELLFNLATHEVESSAASVLLPYPGLQADSGVREMLDQAQKEIIPVKSIVVGQTVHGLSHDRYARTETLLGQWVTDTMRQAVHGDIAFQNIGGIRTGIPAGTITMGELYEAIPFDNTLYTVDMTGEQIFKVLQYGLMNDKVSMLQYSGIKVSYDAEPQGGRIVAVTLADGTPIRPGKTYKVVTNDFMAAGGDGFTMFKEGKNLYNTCIPLRDIVAGAIRNQKTIEFNGDDRFEIRHFSQEQQKNAA
ncbi:MAG: 5'-nucleotidase C-terminal domain-containing protein [Veillonellales bacterium]